MSRECASADCIISVDKWFCRTRDPVNDEVGCFDKRKEKSVAVGLEGYISHPFLRRVRAALAIDPYRGAKLNSDRYDL